MAQGVTIYDDFWEATQLIPERQRAAFIYAIVEYGFSGREPDPKQPWFPIFVVIRRRVQMSGEASERGRAMSEARWGKKGRKDAQASCTTDAQASCTTDAQASCTTDAQASTPKNAESESESEDITPKPPYDAIVRRLNERAGTAFKPTGRKTRELIRARFAEGFDEADFATVIDAMCDEWGGDPEMAGYLRPETLFGTKFEGYLNRPAARSAAARRPRGDPDAAWRPADPVDTPESLAEAEAAFEAKWGEKPC